MLDSHMTIQILEPSFCKHLVLKNFRRAALLPFGRRTQWLFKAHKRLIGRHKFRGDNPLRTQLARQSFPRSPIEMLSHHATLQIMYLPQGIAVGK